MVLRSPLPQLPQLLQAGHAHAARQATRVSSARVVVLRSPLPQFALSAAGRHLKDSLPSSALSAAHRSSNRITAERHKLNDLVQVLRNLHFFLLKKIFGFAFLFLYCYIFFGWIKE